MKNVLVTGGAGFIGSHLVDELIRNNYDVSIIDNLSRGYYKNINSKAILNKIDIRDLKNTNDVFSKFKPDIVFHMAAISSISASDGAEIESVNVLGTNNILKACIKNNINRLVFSSSAAIYGNPDEIPTSENQKPKPLSKYGISKFGAEINIVDFCKKYKLKYSILRYSNVYGPRQQHDNEGGVVSIFSNNIISSQPVSIYSNGKQTRDFIFVKDVVEANILSSQNNLPNFISNISTMEETSILALLNLIEKTTNISVEVAFKEGRPGEINRSCLNNQFANRFLGWHSSTTLPIGIKKTLDKMKTNE